MREYVFLNLLGTAPIYVLTALLVCMVMAGTLILLFHHIDSTSGRIRIGWAALSALVAGVGVWTTHFVAMLGYRPDLTLVYDGLTTFVSAVAGVALVGGPIAASFFVTGWRRATAGAFAGLGVGAMHFTGMSALQGCLLAYNAVSVALGLAFGAGFFAFAIGSDLARRRVLLRAGAIVAGVCTLHFTTLAGLSIELLTPDLSAIDGVMLSALIAVTSLGLSTVGLAVTVSARRLQLERERSADAQAHRNAAFATALRHMSNGLVMVAPDGRISAINERAWEILGLDGTQLEEGASLRGFLDGVGTGQNRGADDLHSMIRKHFDNLAAEGYSRTEEKLEDGRIIAATCKRTPEGGVVLTFDDLTEYRTAEAEIAHLAFHDSLTGLANRRGFREHVQTVVGRDRQTTLLVLDLDRFKPVNDTLDHPVGDALLVAVGERLTGIVDGRGSVFRLGGDELAIVLSGLDDGAARALAEHVVAGAAESFQIGAHTISIGCSIGMTVLAPGEHPAEGLQRADLALYRAKERGRSRVEVYEAGMLEQAQRRRQMELDMRHALDNDGFELHYQPLYRLPDQRLLGFEALIRWKHPEFGFVSPADFIPLAEETGLILGIGAWVLDRACQQLRRWPDNIHVAINVSAVQMRMSDLADDVAAALDRHGATADRLEIELTETALVEDGEAIAETLRRLRRLGVRIAMDDFGTGYSSLAHMRNFELDRIKIDRSFVDTSDDDIGARAVIRAVTSMARDLSILTIGEGVETPEQLARLTELGCDVAQGFLLGRPLAQDVASALVTEQDMADDAAADATVVPLSRKDAA
ncbi:EAL domain-containing protein [uncultured Jannaschia sp.]|uniref:bifunctional diguanylate cyclase/phosphodiesterase n=1 Tax=uncultured Jannaschia sp. TaxID=293347 RepID=UPI0026246E47|nr:EAL domain-containing protein [uncultured Jannaschia sp.]